MRRRTEEGVRAPGRSVWQAGVIRARGISAVWPGPAGDACAGGGRRTFLGEQDCYILVRVWGAYLCSCQNSLYHGSISADM